MLVRRLVSLVACLLGNLLNHLLNLLANHLVNLLNHLVNLLANHLVSLLVNHLVNLLANHLVNLLNHLVNLLSHLENQVGNRQVNQVVCLLVNHQGNHLDSQVVSLVVNHLNLLVSHLVNLLESPLPHPLSHLTPLHLELDGSTILKQFTRLLIQIVHCGSCQHTMVAVILRGQMRWMPPLDSKNGLWKMLGQDGFI